MYKKWLRFFCFSMIFILLFTWVNAALAQPQENWDDFYKIPKNSLDVIFIGNSHSLFTFQPRIVNEIVNLSSYSIGTAGESVLTSYYELREILKYQKPKVVVLETFALDLTRMYEYDYIFGFTDSGIWDINKAAVTAKIIPMDDAHTIFPALRETLNWNEPDQLFTKLMDQLQFTKKEINPSLGTYLTHNFMSKKDFQAAFDMPEAKYHNSLDNNLYYLNKFVELCKENDIQLILATAPFIKISGEGFKYYTPFDVSSYAKKNQLDWLTFDTSSFNEMHYVDADHVNIFGSIILSVDMALDISEKLNLPIDQEKLDYYRSFYFSSYTFKHLDENYCFKLNPENSDAPLEYQFNLLRMEDGFNIFSSGWQQSNEHCFTFPDSDFYYLEVLIRNPDGDYRLDGYYYIYDREN